MSVVSLDHERAKRSPHMTGEARCMACQHTWVGVAQVGTSTLDCPACWAEKGVFLKHARDANSPALHCGCGCWAYAVYSYGLMCINCGDVKPLPAPPHAGQGGRMSEKLHIGGVDPDEQQCLRCGSPSLDTGWECTDCGYDNMPHYVCPIITAHLGAEQ